MSTIFILGIFIFSCSSLYFYLTEKKDFNSAFLVSFITVISYTVMLQGNFAQNDLYWTRWIAYGISCPLLAFEISKRLTLPQAKTFFVTALTGLVMITGAFASVSEGWYKIFFFLLSTDAFILVLNEFYKVKSPAIKSITPYIVFGWCVFPIVFIFSNEGMVSLLSVPVAAAIYLGLDIFTKIIFYLARKK
jgi:bacteriorhodopsin